MTKFNSKHFILKLTMSVIMLALVLTYHIEYKTNADVGNLNRYEDTSSDNSYDYYDDDDDDDDDDYYSSSSNRTTGESRGSSDPLTLPEIIGLLIVIVVLAIAKKKGWLDDKKGRRVRNMNVQPTPQEPIVDVNMLINKIRERDAAFSMTDFESFAREVFIKLQEAWTAREWKTIRPFESNELFNLHSTQLNEYIRLGKINVMEKIAVENITPIDYVIDGDKEKLIIKLSATLRDYVINAQTKEVIEGDPNKDWHMKYKMTFIRTVGVLTRKSENGETSVTNCPNCGAPTEITSAGQCEYCRSVITTGDHGWVLSELSSMR